MVVVVMDVTRTCCINVACVGVGGSSWWFVVRGGCGMFVCSGGEGHCILCGLSCELLWREPFKLSVQRRVSGCSSGDTQHHAWMRILMQKVSARCCRTCCLFWRLFFGGRCLAVLRTPLLSPLCDESADTNSVACLRVCRYDVWVEDPSEYSQMGAHGRWVQKDCGSGGGGGRRRRRS